MDDLISRNVMRKVLEDLDKENDDPWTLEEVAEYILDYQPLVDAELVVHARWVKMGAPTWEGYHWCCSKCGGHITTRYPDYPEDKRCRYCGAKMDENNMISNL